MPRVINRRREPIPSGGILVDRSTKWGNPFRIGVDGTRAEVIARYREYLYETGRWMDVQDELKGKDLVCWCAPEACHADVLLELANG